MQHARNYNFTMYYIYIYIYSIIIIIINPIFELKLISLLNLQC